MNAYELYKTGTFSVLQDKIREDGAHVITMIKDNDENVYHLILENPGVTEMVLQDIRRDKKDPPPVRQSEPAGTESLPLPDSTEPPYPILQGKIDKGSLIPPLQAQKSPLNGKK